MKENEHTLKSSGSMPEISGVPPELVLENCNGRITR